MTEMDFMTQKLDSFTLAYLECALWSTMDYTVAQGGDLLDRNYSIVDIDPASLDRIITDCLAFQDAHWDMIAEDLPRAGHDFWLTRNRHGAGFWDGYWPEEVGQTLTDAAHAFGECDLYVGDDRKLYLA